jgi:PAS domain-containing protein
MLLLDDRRRVLDVNGAYLRLVRRPRDDVVGSAVHRFLAHGAVLSEAEWSAALAARRVTGEAEVLGGDGTRTGVQWAASTEVVTGRRLVLVVVLSTSRWGPRFRREHHDGRPRRRSRRASATSSGSSLPARPGRRSPRSCRSRTTPFARMPATR